MTTNEETVMSDDETETVIKKEQPPPDKVDKKYIFTMLFVTTTSQLMFLNISLMVPLLLNEKDMDTKKNTFYYSIVNSMYQVARLCFSTTIGGTLERVGRKNYIIIGFTFMILTTLGFGLLSQDFMTSSTRTFFVSAFFFRFF